LTADPIARQFVFDTYADLYDRSRPEYPRAMLSDLQADGILHPAADVLEVGAGPGQLTAAVAPLVASVTALEPGDHLAQLAERRVAGSGSVTVVRSAFERWTPPPGRRFDAIVAGTSFHWLERGTRFRRSATLLQPGGAIAASWNMWDGNPLAQFDDLFDALAPTMGERRRSGGSAPQRRDGDEPGRDLFEPWHDRSYRWEVRYAPRGLVEMLATHSAYHVIARQEREAVLDAIERRVPAGGIVIPYVTALRVARLRPGGLRSQIYP
jgi:SAM-dependent methyltransferase